MIPVLLSDEGVATAIVFPCPLVWLAVVLVPGDIYVAKVARDGRLAASEAGALVAVSRCRVQALAGGDAASVVAAASQDRQRVAADSRELVACRRDEELRDLEGLGDTCCDSGRFVDGGVALGGHGGEDAHLAGLQRDVQDLVVANVWPRRVKRGVASEAIHAPPGTGVGADAVWVGNIYIAAPARAVRPWSWQRRRQWRRHHFGSSGS